MGTSTVAGISRNRRSKRVQVRCYEPMAADPTARQLWGDVWIRFKARPGRRVYTYAPCLASRTDLEREADRYVRAREPGRHDEIVAWMREHDLLAPDEPEPTLADTDEDEEETWRILSILKTQPIWFDPEDGLSRRNMPNIYTAAEWLDRAEAERMLDFFLSSLGHGRVRYVWKRPDLIVIPT